jgi:hypothetical protein
VRIAIISFLLAVLASVLCFVLPLYRGQSGLQRFGEPSRVQVRHATLLSVNGPSIYYILVIPVIIAGVPLLLRCRTARIISALSLTGCVVIGAASIGLFYLPSAIAMILAASKKPT